MTYQKLLILDGLSELGLARDVHAACLRRQVVSVYCDLAAVKTARFYFSFKLREKLVSLFSGAKSKRFVPNHKIDPNSLKEIIYSEKPTHILVFRYTYKFINPLLLRRYADTVNANIYLYDTDSCNFFPNQKEFEYFIDNELIIYNEIFSFSKVMTRFFVTTKSFKATYFPYGSNPVTFEGSDVSQNVDVLFVGRASFRRFFLLEGIKNQVSIFGNRWEKSFSMISPELKSKITNRTVWGDELLQLMRRSKIVLNITNSNFYSVETGLNLRIFEALAAGCFLLTDYTDELADLFEIGKEIEAFSSLSELQEKVNFYLENPDARAKIAEAGRKKFYELYSWDKRMDVFFSKVGIGSL